MKSFAVNDFRPSIWQSETGRMPRPAGWEATFYEWMSKGEERPESAYGRFRQAMIRAMAEGEKTLQTNRQPSRSDLRARQSSAASNSNESNKLITRGPT